MKIFLDTANLESIKKFNDMGLLDGITTNPSLMSKEGGNPKDAMEEITKIIQGDVSLEVVSTDYSGMLEEGKRLREYGDNANWNWWMSDEFMNTMKKLAPNLKRLYLPGGEPTLIQRNI